MSSDFKQEFLKNKYEYISDDAANEPLKKTKKKKPKKSNHKHEYKNLNMIRCMAGGVMLM